MQLGENGYKRFSFTNWWQFAKGSTSTCLKKKIKCTCLLQRNRECSCSRWGFRTSELHHRPQGASLTSFNDGGPTEVHILYPKNDNFIICLPKKSLLFLAYPKKSLSPFFRDPKKIPASFIDPKISLLAKISDPPKNSLGSPRH